MIHGLATDRISDLRDRYFENWCASHSTQCNYRSTLSLETHSQLLWYCKCVIKLLVCSFASCIGVQCIFFILLGRNRADPMDFCNT